MTQPADAVPIFGGVYWIPRAMAVEYGLVARTPEEQAQEDRRHAEYLAWRRSWRGRVMRARMWLRAHRPVLHFGECECDE